MLLGLRILPGRTLAGAYEVCLSAHRRGIFCRSLYLRPRPFAPSTRSAAARLIDLRRWLVRRGRRGEGNSTGGFYEIPTDDRGGSRAGRHSERNIAFS